MSGKTGKLLFIEANKTRQGVEVGIAWKNKKGGYGISLARDIQYEGKSEEVQRYEILFHLKGGKVASVPFPCSVYGGKRQGGKMLLVVNRNKGSNEKAPDMRLFAYPKPEK